MAVFDVSSQNLMTQCWFPKDLASVRQRLTAQQDDAIVKWINKHVFDAALSGPKQKMNVTHALRNNIPSIPSFEGTELQALHDVTHDFERTRLIYGNSVCEIGIQRAEQWWRYKEKVGEDQESSTYVLGSHLTANAG